MLQTKQTIESVRQHGHRLTPQRRLVLEIVNESKDHLDAEKIFQQAKQRDNRISLATVYRSLALLKEVGLIVEHSLGEDHAHFESAQSSPHYHFTCEKCGCVLEFGVPEINNILKKLSSEKEIEIHEVHFFLTGVCHACRKK